MRWLRRISGIVWIFSWYTIYLEIFRDLPVASHDEIASFQSTATASRNGYPT